MVEGESSRTNSDMLRLGWMIRSVGCSCSPSTSYLPRVRVRVATVRRFLHPRCRWARIFVGLHLLDTLCISGVDASNSRGSGHLIHECNCVVPRHRCHIRIRSLPISMASVPTHLCVVVVRISSDRSGYLHPYRDCAGTVVALLVRRC